MTQPNNKRLQWHRIVSQPFDQNTFILHLNGSTAGVIIDPGFEPEKVDRKLQAEGISPIAILNTHGHSDHIAGNAYFKRACPSIPLLIGALDADKLRDPNKNLSAPFGVSLVSPEADKLLYEGDRIELADLDLEVWETPGHSRGHVVFLCRLADPWVVVGGDVLFSGSIGRTDFPDGDHGTLVRVIRDRLFSLPEDTLVLPGHGPPTTIGEERAHNPFVGDLASRY